MRESVGYGPPVPAAMARAGRPPLPPAWVSLRSRLTEALDAGTRGAVTLVCAGPGWGKTSLVESWAKARSGNGRIAWLACDEGSTFWSDLTLALRASGAVDPGEAVDGPESLHRLGSGPRARVVLVLDDLHKVTEPRVLDGLAGLLRRPPEWLHLLLVTRAEPELPLYLPRVAGELTELRTRDLAFRAHEVAEMLALRDRSMPSGQIADLIRDTEGWGAGLRLVLDAPPGVGADEAVADYLIHEVLAAEPPQVREFLLRTSVPNRVSGGLAEALTAQQSSHVLLQQLERANVFVESVGAGGWFRYHRQFRATPR